MSILANPYPKSMDPSIRTRIERAVTEACMRIWGGVPPGGAVEKPRREGHGDLSTNAALILGKERGEQPREIALRIAGELMGRAEFHPALCEKVEVAGGGFINFFLSQSALRDELALIARERDGYGRGSPEKRQRIIIEFVSANPTGPLTVAHGRQAAVGDSLARILEKAGHEVVREYYLNDTGTQIRLLGLSTLQRYREFFGERAQIPEGGYRGDYVRRIAERIKAGEGDRLLGIAEEEAIGRCAELAVEEIKEGILRDLDDFRVRFDRLTSERQFSGTGLIDECIASLRRGGFVYDRDGAVWFRSEAFGDDKDRVLVKSDGERTYFAPDIAYHADKFKRGFDRVIDLWGPDHHGYIARMRAAVKALGYSGEQFTPLIVQLTTLYRGRRKLSMSTRAGEFITLRELMDDIGVDASRYFFARMRVESHLNFDLELAKRRSNDNPVYYVGYVHARICSIFRKLGEKKAGFELAPVGEIDLGALREAEELNLMKILADFPEAVRRSAEALAPNLICNYLEELAAGFHQFYAAHAVISDDDNLTAARLTLADAVRVVVRCGLGLLGVSAPERM